ncbi:hypothetical protein KO505_06465 [Psychrosphaera sp. F3M07]|uniref:hypothetical protein n=1 Tax=Psychrosphaera sp. F3M07 TaxID=2841560 RepID=UPI001C083B0C|nr:hypothetical protein [Psychrosphaera sp. F3M07]MBU2917606.1 hypothetical protein [Psychrosphaera sp. F3M07]
MKYMIVNVVTILLMFSPQVVAKTQVAIDDILQELSALESCESTSSCPQDLNNPRNSFYLLGEKISQQINRAIELQKNIGEHAEFVELGQFWYQYPNQLVQQAALSLLSPQTAKMSTGKVILRQFGKLRDASLVKMSLDELARYPELEQETFEVISGVLTSGSFSAAKAVAKNISVLLNEDNIASYQSLLTQLPPKSAKARFLSQSLNNYKIR